MVQYCCCLYAFINSYSLFLLHFFYLGSNLPPTKPQRNCTELSHDGAGLATLRPPKPAFFFPSHFFFWVSLINLISMNVNCLHLIRNATVFLFCVSVCLCFLFRDLSLSQNDFQLCFQSKATRSRHGVKWMDLAAND